MHTIIVTDGDDAAGAAEQLRGSLEAGGVEVLALDSSRAPGAIASAHASGRPWTVVLTGDAAPAGFDAVAEHGSVSGVVSLGGTLGDRQLALLGDWPELPILTVARPDDRPALRVAVDAYLAARHPRSDLIVDDAPASEAIAVWLVARMGDRPDVEHVVCTSEDGWEIHGTLTVPRRPEPVPGVVLLHTGRSDRSAYVRLERLLAEQGLAVLNVDWRGRGESTNLGSYFDLDDATKFAAWRDALAALERLAGDPRVDTDRLAAVGCVHGAEYAVRAAWRDRHVKALVILTGYRPHEPEEAELLVSGEVDVMYVNATGHTITGEAMRELCRRAPRGRAQLVEYQGSALGYQLFEIDPELEPRIAGWLQGVLS
jgi:dienelactone hydrolase